MSGSIDFEFRFRPAAGSPRSSPQGTPLRLLVMGDFSGRPAGGLAERRTYPVDLDSLETVMARLAPRLDLALGGVDGGSLAWRGESLEDFHPDRLYRSAEILEPGATLRARLLDPAHFAAAAEELKRGAAILVGAPRKEADADLSAQASEQDEDQAALLDRLLGQSRGASTRTAAPRAAGPAHQDLAGFIKRLVDPHVLPDVEPEQSQLVSVVEDGLSRQLRAILHHPAFQALESRWRALEWLVSNLETDGEIEIHVLDVNKADIIADLARAGGDPTASALHEIIVEGGAGAGWSLLVGAFAFGAEGPADLELLAALGTIASHGGGPLLAEADPALLGCQGWAEAADPSHWRDLDSETAAAWRALRRAPVARWIGLAAPRVLLRLPYGPRTDPVDSFPFDELSARRAHEDYLWGNPAFACALLIGQGFQDAGWSASPGDRLELTDLPAHSFTEDGEARLQAATEAYLGERAVTAILQRGPMALISHRNRNAARLARFQSIADPATALAGPWSG